MADADVGSDKVASEAEVRGVRPTAVGQDGIAQGAIYLADGVAKATAVVKDGVGGAAADEADSVAGAAVYGDGDDWGANQT